MSKQLQRDIFLRKSLNCFSRKINKWMTLASSSFSVEICNIWQCFPHSFSQLIIFFVPFISQIPHLWWLNACWWGCRWKTVESAQLKWFLLVILDSGDRCRWVDLKSRFLSAKPDDLNVISALPYCLIGPAVSHVKCCFVLSWNRKK